MKRKFLYFQSAFVAAAICIFSFSANIFAQITVEKKTQNVVLGETTIKINVYEKPGAAITFFAPHFNEQTGTKIAKELIEKKGGRIVEIEALDSSAKPARHLSFSLQGKSYTFDPNRIYTENGRVCAGYATETIEPIKNFSVELLKMIFDPADQRKLRGGERFLIAVHNNRDVDSATDDEAKFKDLTSYSFLRNGKIPNAATGEHQAQADGVFLSQREFDEDNFVFLSTPAHLGFFAGKGFNVVLQKPAAQLQNRDCRIDDGSLSVYAGQHNIPYINLEADTVSGGFRQRQMLEAVYELAQK